MNCLLNPVNPKKLCTDLISYSIGYSFVAFTFLGLARIPLVVTI